MDATLLAEGEPIRVQDWEMAPIAVEVVECAAPNCAALVPPPDLPAGAFGPRLTAMGSLLHGRVRLGMRETAAAFADLLGVPIGPGSVSALCREVSAALEETYDAAPAHVEAVGYANVDETGWRQAGERRWLWVAVTALCTVFAVARQRSAAALLSLLGDAFAGVVSSDRFKAYLSIPLERRQVRWAHLKRNLVAFAERSGEVGDWGTEAVGLVEKVLVAWHRHKDGGVDRSTLQAEIAPLRTQAQELWERRAQLPSGMARARCNDVRKLEPALWTLVTVERSSLPTTPPSAPCGRRSCGARAASARTAPTGTTSWRRS